MTFFYYFTKRFNIQRKVWGSFCKSIGEGYKSENPYHNASHGADVMNSVHYILDFAGLRRRRGKHHELSSAEFFGALLAALIHDYKVKQKQKIKRIKKKKKFKFWFLFFFVI